MDDQTFIQFAKDVLETMRGFIATDNDGIVTYISHSYAKTLDLSQDECIGRHVTKVIPNTRMHIVTQRQKDEMGRFMYVGLPASEATLCNRLILYRNGDKTPELSRGAIAFGVITADQDPEKLLSELEVLRKQNELYQDHLAQIYQTSYDPDELMGSSPAMQATKNLIRRVSATSATVCILGETGVGKELVANAIHKLSKRADKPFVKINCAAIPRELIESELFGYEPGAFTGASRQGKIGKFELADGGTLLLDEIGDLSLNLQAKLLRVLQAGEVERVGGTAPIPINVRLICSTNQNLKQMVADGTFRSDLYYRINTLEIPVPALRDRLEDIPGLAARFVSQSNEKNELGVLGITEQTVDLLLSHSWPGNVRELEHAIERACVLCGHGLLEPQHFSSLLSAQTSAPRSESAPDIPDPSLLRSQSLLVERKAILQALDTCHGNKRAAADLLGVSRATLYNKLKRLGLS